MFFFFLRGVSYSFSISDIRLETHLGKDSTSSNNSNYGSRGALAWTPPASMEGSTPTWTEGTPSFTESSSSENGEIGNGWRRRSEMPHRFNFLLIVNRILRLIIASQSLVDVGQAQANGRESPQLPHVGNGESLLYWIKKYSNIVQVSGLINHLKTWYRLLRSLLSMLAPSSTFLVVRMIR